MLLIFTLKEIFCINISVEGKQHSWDNSDIHKKIYWCYFKEGVLVSLHEKTGAKMRIYINDIKEHSAHLHKYWFNFKNCTGILFGICKLYYKLLYMYSHQKVMKSLYHNMVGNRPRTVQVNCTLLQHFIDIIWTQIRDIYYLVSTRYILKIQDTTTMVSVHANIALENS